MSNLKKWINDALYTNYRGDGCRGVGSPVSQDHWPPSQRLSAPNLSPWNKDTSNMNKQRFGALLTLRRSLTDTWELPGKKLPHVGRSSSKHDGQTLDTGLQHEKVLRSTCVSSPCFTCYYAGVTLSGTKDQNTPPLVPVLFCYLLLQLLSVALIPPLQGILCIGCPWKHATPI